MRLLKLAIIIISLFLTVVIGIQSVSAFIDAKIPKINGILGILIAILYLSGGALTYNRLKISMMIFVFAGLLALINGTTSNLSEMNVYGILAFIFAILNFYQYINDGNIRSEL